MGPIFRADPQTVLSREHQDVEISELPAARDGSIEQASLAFKPG